MSALSGVSRCNPPTNSSRASWFGASMFSCPTADEDDDEAPMIPPGKGHIKQSKAKHKRKII